MSVRTTNSNIGGGDFFGVLGVRANRTLVVTGNVDEVCWRGHTGRLARFCNPPFRGCCPDWGWAEGIQPDAGLLLGQQDIDGRWVSLDLEAKPQNGIPLQAGNLCIRTQIVLCYHMLYHKTHKKTIPAPSSGHSSWMHPRPSASSRPARPIPKVAIPP